MKDIVTKTPEMVILRHSEWIKSKNGDYQCHDCKRWNKLSTRYCPDYGCRMDA